MWGAGALPPADQMVSSSAALQLRRGMERDTSVIHTSREGAQVTGRHYASADLLPSVGLSFSICTLGGAGL